MLRRLGADAGRGAQAGAARRARRAHRPGRGVDRDPAPHAGLRARGAAAPRSRPAVRDVRGDDPLRPRAPRSPATSSVATQRRTAARSRASRPTSTSRATTSRCAASSSARPAWRRSGEDVEVVGRLRERARARARGPHPRRLVPPRAHGRHAGSRAIPRAGAGGDDMSGHSKWSSIKHKKGAADAKRGKLFSKLSRAIIVAAREGGPDPDGNATLATAIQKARDASMPKDNIERAIARGAGTATDGEVVRDRDLRGLRRRRRGRLRRGLDGQPQPHGRRRAPRLRQARGQPGDERHSRVALRAQGRAHRPGRRGRRGVADARGGRRRRGGRRARRLELPGDLGARRPRRRACRARRGGHRLRLCGPDDAPEDDGRRGGRGRRRRSSSA